MNNRKSRFLSLQKNVNRISITNPGKIKGFNRGGGQRFGRTTKTALTLALVCIVFVSIFILVPKDKQSVIAKPDPTATPDANSTATPHTTLNPTTTWIAPVPPPPGPSTPQNIKTPGIIELADSNITSSTWMAIARTAWKYYSLGVGVDYATYLPWTGRASPYITDWDIGVYIQAVVDAGKLGLIDDTLFNARMGKVMSWLETRELNNASYPYWFYQAFDGKVWHENSDKAGFIVDTADTGRLFVALYNLKTYSSTFAPRVDAFIYNNNGNRSNYAALVPSMKAESFSSTSIYSYYAISGFACFWPSELAGAPARVLTNMFSSSTGNITTAEGITLPKVRITGDPLLSAYFELSNKDANLGKLVNLTYSAHEALYNATGKLRAFGEGPTFSTDWQWEWVTLPDGRTWIALNDKGEPVGSSPMVYTKIAWSFLAITNTNFTRTMAIYIEQKLPNPTNDGYAEGADETGAGFEGYGSLTNGLILDAALYYIQNKPY